MKSIPYFPGCTHLTVGTHLERSGKSVFRELGFELVEMDEWVCCGTVSGLSDDSYFHQVAPIRNLARVEAAGSDTLLTFCAMCYNTLTQANLSVKEDRERLDNINQYMDDEPDYHGGVNVMHALQFLRDEVGFSDISEMVSRPLRGLRVAPYYGCLLLRPPGVGIDNPESPRIMSDLLRSLGAEVIYDPRAVQCCGSYHTVDKKEAVIRRVGEIVTSFRRRGADIIALSCPLCNFNLERRQELLGIEPLPVVYFTQLMAMAMGLEEHCHFESNYIDPRPLLRQKGLLE